MIDIILLIIAFACFVAAALKFEIHPRISLLAVGLACWVLTALL